MNHLGFQVNNTEEVVAMGERLRQAGLLTIDEMGTTCCYAVQDKVWVNDPDGNAWEVFFTSADSEFESADNRQAVCCAPPSQPSFVSLEKPKANTCC